MTFQYITRGKPFVLMCSGTLQPFLTKGGWYKLIATCLRFFISAFAASRVAFLIGMGPAWLQGASEHCKKSHEELMSLYTVHCRRVLCKQERDAWSIMKCLPGCNTEHFLIMIQLLLCYCILVGRWIWILWYTVRETHFRYVIRIAARSEMARRINKISSDFKILCFAFTGNIFKHYSHCTDTILHHSFDIVIIKL